MAAADPARPSIAADKERLLAQLKREVKHVMEESANKAVIHEESGLVLALCACVDSCVSHGLRPRILGLFGASSTFALLHKVAKLSPPANAVLKLILTAQKEEVGRERRHSERVEEARQRYLWIRVALSHRLLHSILLFLHTHASKYYTTEALMADPVRGAMACNLLDDLVVRGKEVELKMRRNASVVTIEEDALPPAAREYVHSMHQNAKATLLYGKNNVSVCPVNSRHLMKGYLSLHQNGNGTLAVKWTPNELMHSESVSSAQAEKNSLWKSALNINVDDIVYLHFHQKGQTGGSIVLVGADGVQNPPIHFPHGQHPLAFLSCLENGLLPWGQLDPPLWLQRGKGKVLPKLRRKSTIGSSGSAEEYRKLSNGKAGKVPPSPGSATSMEEEEEDDPNLTHDYVFRVVPLNRPGPFSEAMTSPMSVGSNLSGGDRGPGLVSSRLVALSSLSAKLKDRFLSLSSSPNSSPPPTPKSGNSTDRGSQEMDDAGPAPVGRRSNDPHEPVQKRFSEPVFTLSEREAHHYSPAHIMVGGDDHDTRESSLKSACDSMRNQIISRAFYGWLAHCRHLKTIREHLSCLVESKISSAEGTEGGLTRERWDRLRREARAPGTYKELCRIIYYAGIAEEGLRREVWPYLTSFVRWDQEVPDVFAKTKHEFEEHMTAWMAVEAIVRQRDKEQFQAARAWREKGCQGTNGFEDEVVESELEAEQDATTSQEPKDSPRHQEAKDSPRHLEEARDSPRDLDSGRSTPEEGEGGIYTKELIDTFALNLHRIEKDVQRCDRNHPYFAPTENLEKLKNIMCTFVWQNLETGYIQGMCDIAAPLLVVFDDEVMAYGCFCKLMERMSLNFPHAGGMDAHLANMRSLIQVMDPELFDLMRQNGDYTHFYFCYRWFLLDFKRELGYGDVLGAWEVMWAGRDVASTHFLLFLALAFLLMYRPIILDNNMDFTDIIKFYNEMAERHDAKKALTLARAQVLHLQTLIRDDSHRTPTPRSRP